VRARALRRTRRLGAVVLHGAATGGRGAHRIFWDEESGKKGGCRPAVEVCRVFAAALSWWLRPNAAARLLLLPLQAAPPLTVCCRGAQEFTDEFNTENRFKIASYPAVSCFVFFMQRLPKTPNWRPILSEPHFSFAAKPKNFKEVALRANSSKAIGIWRGIPADCKCCAVCKCVCEPAPNHGISSEWLMKSSRSSSV